MFCENALTVYPIEHFVFPHDVGIVKIVIGMLYIVMSCITVFWIHHQERVARRGDNEAVHSVIFPIFTKMMWLSAFSSLSVGFLMLFVPVEVTSSNSGLARWLYPLAWALQHAVIEGMAFLFMQKGVGNRAAKIAGIYTLSWCTITFIIQCVVYSYGGVVAIVAQVIWSIMMLVFYLALWKLPRNKLFRRPAAISYAQFWFYFRTMTIIFFIFAESGHAVLSQIGACGYVFGPLLLFALVQPLLCYWSLLQDSSWWQGLTISQGVHRLSEDSMVSPLLGVDISLCSAQALAMAMDNISSTTRLINFAHIYLDKGALLGQGSFSRVYRGSYRKHPCAIKLIFTLDLTPGVIRRVCAEATILTAARSPNVVHIYGVSVLPPSVCIVLELCSFGSLADVLRGDGEGQERIPLQLSWKDRIFLALGCARGVASLHGLNKSVVHRDIKSFNFLVDCQLNAKLADLELGNTDETPSLTDDADIQTDDILVNWLAPEVLQAAAYSQASDVYALALVLWEIVSEKIPYEAEVNTGTSYSIKNMVTAGYRPSFPASCPPDYQYIVTSGWSASPLQRPSAPEMVSALTNIWKLACDESLLLLGAHNEVITSTLDFCESPIDVRHVEGNQSSFIKKDSSCSSVSSSKFCSIGSYVRNNSTPVHHSIPPSSAQNGSEIKHPMPELQELYTRIRQNDCWSALDELSDPVVIVSKMEPHIILKCSPAFVSLLGYESRQLFGRTLDCVIDSHYSFYTDSQDTPLTLLSRFYTALGSTGMAHMVNNIVNLDQQSIQCSFHGYVIERIDGEEEVKDGATLESNQHSSPGLSSTDTRKSDSRTKSWKSRFSFLLGNSPSINNESVAFYAVYATCLHDSSPTQQDERYSENQEDNTLPRTSDLSAKLNHMISINSLSNRSSDVWSYFSGGSQTEKSIERQATPPACLSPTVSVSLGGNSDDVVNTPALKMQGLATDC